MLVAELIRRKRDGGELHPGEWKELLTAYASGEVPDYQISALMMAVFYSGVTAVVLLGGFRSAWEMYRKSARSSGAGAKPIVLVGSRTIPRLLARRIREERAYGYELAAVVINMNLWTRLKLAQGATPHFA